MTDYLIPICVVLVVVGIPWCFWDAGRRYAEAVQEGKAFLAEVQAHRDCDVDQRATTSEAGLW